MYLEHFGLREFPFGMTPDTDFFFHSKSAQEALNTLIAAIKTGEGFVKITGEIGTGKSTLCRQLIAKLEPDYQIVYLPNPLLSPETLLNELAHELGIGSVSDSRNQPVSMRAINERLIALNRLNKKIVVCLDETQAMPIETLEALRLVSNLESEKQKLIQVVMFGQPELDQKLNQQSIRQLKQRIAFQYTLKPLDISELSFYLQHRLGIAGHRGGALFTKAATGMLRGRTRCVPRLVNIVAHKGMLSAYGKGKHQVELLDIWRAVLDTPFLRQREQIRLLSYATALAAGLLAAGLALI